MFSKKANASFVVPYATKDIIINIKINLKIVIKVCNLEIAIFFIKSADTCAFKKKARGIARNATNAIPNSTISIVASNTNNQTICDGDDLVSMVFNIGGGAKGAIYSGILPEGLDIYLDDPNNPTTATISGTLNTGDSASNIYDFTITTASNQDSCSEASFNATIIVDPKDSISLTSNNQTTSQEVCVESPINDITYEIGGNANSVDVVGLPPGVIQLSLIHISEPTRPY